MNRVHFEQLVDVFWRRVRRAGGDALFAAVLEDVRAAALLRGHGIDNSDLPLEHWSRRYWHWRELILILADARQHAPSARSCRPSVHLRKLFAQVGRDQRRPLRMRSGARIAFLASMGAARLLDQRDHVAHAEGCGRRCEGARTLPARRASFAGADQLDRLAPVNARIDSARTPPRPSPSTRVSTMPVSPTRSSKARARLTASWPVNASATSRTSCGLAAR